MRYDKDRRWADRKDEQVLAVAITQEPGLVLIPALMRLLGNLNWWSPRWLRRRAAVEPVPDAA